MKNNYRWTICGLLFFATTINYIDRQVLSILAPQLQILFGWSEKDYGYIVMAFQAAYAVGLLFTGRFLDRFGVRIGYTIAMIVWSFAAAGHAMATSVLTFATARFGLALGESANFPAAVKTVAEWFPKKERALATGLFNSGSTIGAIVGPVLIPSLCLAFGWQAAFVVTGCLGFVWIVFWLWGYRTPEKKAAREELLHILSDDEPGVSVAISWRQLLRHRQTLGICIGRFVTDPIWWFFLNWLPKYLSGPLGVDLQGLGVPLIIIYTLSSVGGIGGGWLSSFLIRRGKSIDFARKTTILIVAFLVMPVFLLSYFPSLTLAVALIGLATAAHQAWASNIYTVVSDIFPKSMVASMVGLTGFAGALGGILFAPAVGWILELTGNYRLIFAVAGIAYLLAWLALKVFIPKIEPLALSQSVVHPK
jgi:ACS family hexuronate transporter-like MFS transporter